MRDFKALKFKTEHVAICAWCVADLNATPEPSEYAEARLGELLRKGMMKRGTTNFKAEYDRALPGWINRLVADQNNRSHDFKVVRAHRRGLIRRTGGRQRDYPKDWIERSRRARVRDGCCMSCGVIDERLDVHHIVYLSNYGTNQQGNLVSLCRSCHENEHGREFDLAETADHGYSFAAPPPSQPQIEPQESSATRSVAAQEPSRLLDEKPKAIAAADTMTGVTTIEEQDQVPIYRPPKSVDATPHHGQDQDRNEMRSGVILGVILFLLLVLVMMASPFIGKP